MQKRIAVATSEQYSRLAKDELLTLDHLTSRGIVPVPTVWNDPTVDWKAFDQVIIRSTWDYSRNLHPFKAWLHLLRELRVPVINPIDTVLWNLDKTYLRHFEKKKIPIVPTHWIFSDRKESLEVLEELVSTHDYIIKPSVSAEAFETHRISGNRQSEIKETVKRLLQLGTVMVQPFLDEIQTQGEWSLIFFQDQFSHAVIKTPAPKDYRVQVSFGGKTEGRKPPQAVLDRARNVLAALEQPYFFARVDLIPSKGDFLLSEIELIEPSLYFVHSDGVGPKLYAEALSAWIPR